MVKLDLLPAEKWDVFKDRERPFVIAGPCSAESEEQIFDTARQLKALGISVFRAGIWKPRTHPNCFEGVGAAGLVWMKRVQRELGMAVATEVANAKHVHEVLKAGIDILWIGARTSANPFAVQEIADALKGVDIPVFVKNPVNPDLELWTGALERLNMAGLRKLGMIHRGFSAYEETKYRNVPQWQLPIEMHLRFPEMPVIADPSHMAGVREYIPELAQRAMDLGFDGLMIEAHNCPAIALSDAGQQFTPDDLKKTLDKLIIRNADTENSEYRESIEELRNRIDCIDEVLISLIAKRMSVAEKIGQYKKENNITILQANRWDKVLAKVRAMAEENGLDPEFIDKLFKTIHQASIDRQTDIMNK